MKTAGIVTYWVGNSNYGTILQNYAVQQVLKKNDIQGITIRYNVCQSISLKRKILQSIQHYGLLQTVLGVLNRKFLFLYKKYCNINDVKRGFNEFIEIFINRTEKIFISADDIMCNLSKMDLYIAGSDQIWSVDNLLPFYAQQEIPIAFLEFCPKEAKRISFAASFGSTTFKSPYKAQLSNDLKNFDFLSVREKSGIDICNEWGIKKAIYHLDPTLMLTKADYRKVIDNNCERPRGKYVFLYLLNDSTDFVIGDLYKWAKKQKMKVIYVNGNTDRFRLDFHKKKFASVPEWLSLIDNAEYVFTNSFHGAVFSIIFNKKFSYMNQRTYFRQKNPRIESLFEILSLNDRFYCGNFDNVQKDIDYNRVNDFLQNYQKNSAFVNYLKMQ